ncbi:MAG: Fe-S cluster assembly protein SufD [Gemmatimonadota bacterium]|nr:MAG: Fe-S cluster assembly protein SufD [Gemmatimonadota bacterium]
MTTIVKQGLRHYLESFKRFENGAGGPDWVRSVRRAAIERMAELGFPTASDEDWRFTNLTSLAGKKFDLEAGGTEPAVLQLGGLAFPGDEAVRLVFVNGRFAPGLSKLGKLDKGVIVASLARALSELREVVEAHLSRYLDYESDFFSALNTAFMEDGAFVYVPRGVVVELPIHLLFVATATAEPAMSHPRNLIVVEDVAQAAVIEDYVALGDQEYFSNVATELVAGESSVVDHYLIERESARAYSVGTLRVQQARSSNVASHTLLFGGALVRNNVHPVLAGEGAECLVNGLFMPARGQHMDNFMRVEHASPHCASRQFYTGILDGNGRGAFSGRIIVHKDAQKTDAKQTNRNLLLSNDAQMDSKPQLEIYADDVKCTHGATIGQLDEDAIFYLRARGIPREVATALLLYGFAAENLERMRLQSVRRYLEGIVLERLPHGSILRELS